MDEVQEAAIVQTNLEALPGSPTAEQILQAITGYSQNAVNIAMERTAGGAAGPDTTWEGWFTQIDPGTDPHRQSGYTDFDLNQYIGRYGTLNDYMEWDIELPPGDYTFQAVVTIRNDQGIATVKLDGATIGTCDCYDAGAETRVRRTFTFTIAAAGSKRVLRWEIVSKNASSSNYFVKVFLLSIRRTA